MENKEQQSTRSHTNIESLADHAKQLTLQLQDTWEQSRYPAFLKNANRNEVLRSQEPFFYAVEAFPRFLLQLASMISTSKARLSIVENIWEEHGKGSENMFHTTTFLKHLEALGYQSDTPLRTNPFVQEWIDNIFDSINSQVYFNVLAAIEYVYALISDTIAEHLTSMELLSEQIHYTKHSKLDWDHGAELLESMLLNGDRFDENLFVQTQREFINLFNRLVVPTQKEIQYISGLPVAFYHTRESQQMLDKIMHSMNARELDVLTICSGGEHVLHYLAEDKVKSVHAIDMNEHQIDVCKMKLDQALKGNVLLMPQEGKFESLFKMVREFFRDENGTLDKSTITRINRTIPGALTYIMDMVFAKDVLDSVFTEEATRYSSESFSEHFFRVYERMIDEIWNSPSDNACNVLLDEPIGVKPPKHKLDQRIGPIIEQSLTFEHINAKGIEFAGTYDIIDLSNIGDWMPQPEFQAIVDKAVAALKPQGRLVLRRLLGDYKLSDLNNRYTVDTYYDDTHFYSESVTVSR